MNFFEHLAQTVTNCKAGNSGCSTNLPQVAANQDQLKAILAVIFGVIAAVAVLTIIIASYNFVTGGGDSEKISKAKNTIVYALVGLAIAIFAEAIVLTVLGKL